jgi:preprotein translocase subunit SecA
MDRLGLEEGEVIQHSMITKSIERAQKKVEENNFGIRKRLLEYDDVMNSQREVIYKKRKNALFGERLSLDIVNMMYDTCEVIAQNFKNSADYDALKISSLSALGFDLQLSLEECNAQSALDLTNTLFELTLENYHRKNEQTAKIATPVLRNVQEQRGATTKEILIPFTDGKKQIGVVADLAKAVETEGKELVHAMEKASTLAIIDNAWKEHLRDMDDLKQSVQNAVYEQKDPLLIYKFEAFELFKKLTERVNEESISFLTKAILPLRSDQDVREARQTRPAKQNYQESKAESQSALAARGPMPGPGSRPTAEITKPIKSEKIMGRNDRVNVQYPDGTVLKDVKFKKVEEDLKANKCVLID